MEFTGDLFFQQYPDLQPAILTQLRSANVDTEKLARAAMHHGLHKFVRHERPMLDAQIQEFTDVFPEYPIHSMGLIDAPKVLVDMVESTIGAIYVDNNYCLGDIIYKECLQVDIVDIWKENGEVRIYHANQVVGKGKYKPKRIIALNRAAHRAYDEIQRKLAEDISTLNH